MNGTVPVETLHFKGSYTTSNFHLTKIAGGTDVTFNPSGGAESFIKQMGRESSRVARIMNPKTGEIWLGAPMSRVR